MPDTCRRALCAAFLLALACGGTDANLDPDPASVTPGEGSAHRPTAVLIHGKNFLARTVQPASGGEPSIDTRHRAWIANVELLDVVWVDVETLRATVPAGVPAGPQPLLVENALGRRGELASAFVVRTGPAASIEAALATGATVSIGQEATLTLTVTNAGTGPVTNVAPATPSVESTSGSAAVALLTGPTPATLPSLEPGGRGVFTWTFTGTAAGTGTLSASASGEDGVTQDRVGGSASAPIVIQQPAALAATAFRASRTTLDVGQTTTVTLSLRNAGEATAAISASRLEMTAGTGTCGDSTPSAPLTIAGGASATFTWSCTPSAPGNVTLSATVAATDVNSGANVSPALGAIRLTVQSPAVLGVTSFLATSPVKINHRSSLTLTLRNTGGATANVAAILVSVNLGSQSAGVCSAVAPAPPQAIAGGASTAFTWTCTPSALGTVTASAAVSAVDVNSGDDVSPAVPLVAIAVQP